MWICKNSVQKAEAREGASALGKAKNDQRGSLAMIGGEY